jgi:hypothetical protein
MLLAIMRWRSARTSSAFVWISRPPVSLSNMKHLDWIDVNPGWASLNKDVGQLWEKL